MSYQIFCPQEHLILDSRRCEVCGWERSAPADLGKVLWGPLDLGSGLGGPGSGVPAFPAAVGDTAVFYLRSTEIVGVNLRDGRLLWRNALPSGLITQWLVADGKRILASLSETENMKADTRSYLAAIDPAKGSIQMIWESAGHLLTPPLLTRDSIYIRNVASELVCLSREEKPQEKWRCSLENFLGQPLILAGNLVLVNDGRFLHGEGCLKAFDQQNGRLCWDVPLDEFISDLPCVFTDRFIYRDLQKKLVARSLQDGSLLWERNYEWVYCPPASDGEALYVCVRGEGKSSADGRYQLKKLNPLNGEEEWSFNLKSRVRLDPRLNGDTLILGGDDGTIFALQTSEPALVWEYPLGSEEDPVRAFLLQENGLLAAGTYSGLLAGLQSAAQKTSLQSPQEHLAQAEWKEAAAAYALQGDFMQAAQLYQEKLVKPHLALKLLEHGEFYKEAGDLALKNGLLSQAEMYFQKCGEEQSLADVLLKKGDKLGAAEAFEKAGLLEEAVGLYEQEGQTKKAFEIYLQLGQINKWAGRQFSRFFRTEHVEKIYEKNGVLAAASAAREAGHWHLALKWLKEATEQEIEGARELEYETLQDYTRDHEEVFAFERLARTARRLGKFKEEAQALQKLDRPELTAEAFKRAAQQAEIKKLQSNEIAYFYEQAAVHYREAGEDLVKCEECEQKVRKYQQRPWLEVRAYTDKAFRENQWSLVLVEVVNKGYGLARNIQVLIGEGHFELDEHAGDSWGDNLKSQGALPQKKVYLRPLKESVGEEVPLVLECRWEDRSGKPDMNRTSKPVTVRRALDSKTGGSMVIGTYVEGPITNTRIEGDQLQSGAQKGDKVEIYRGSKSKVYEEELKEKSGSSEVRKGVTCPVCSLMLEPGAKHCDNCGQRIL